jgi:hypothetical protein
LVGRARRPAVIVPSSEPPRRTGGPDRFGCTGGADDRTAQTSPCRGDGSGGPRRARERLQLLG